MTDNEFYIILGIVLLAALDLTTVAAQTALLQASLPRLLFQHEQDGKKLDPTISLFQSPVRVQASLNLARLVWRFTMAGLILYIFLQPAIISGLLAGLAGLFVSAIILFCLELIVQVVVLRSPTVWLIRLTTFARLLTFLCTPFIWLAQKVSGSQQSVPDVTGTIAVTEDELRTLVDAGQQEGLLEAGERRMIHSIFELGNTLVREIMVPRIDMLALDVQTPLPDAVDAFLKSGHSRVPVYEETVDNILGLLYAKDLLRVFREGDQLGSLRSLLRAAYFVPEAKKVDELLAEMQRQRVHMAVVVDEYGGIAGLVTLEDIVEEILGEIQDEYDQAEELPYEELASGEYIFLGRIDLDDFNEVTGSNLPKDEADTLAGFIYSRLGRVPSSGESLRVNDLLLTVEHVSGRRIRKVHVQTGLIVPPDNERVTDVSE